MADLTSPNETYLTRLRRNGYSQGLPESTFGENFNAALNIGIYEDMSNSRNIVMSNHQNKRMQAIIEANRKGLLPDDMVNRFRTTGPGWSGVNANLLAVHSKDHPEYGLDIQTDQEILDGIRDDLKIVKTSYAELQSRAKLTGTLGGFAGSTMPYALDPLLMPSWFVGYGEAATGAKMLAGLGRVIGAEAGLEAASQVFQYQWKDEVSEASLKESIASIAMVAGLTAGIGVTAIGLSKGLRKIINKSGLSTDEIGQSWAYHKASQAAEEFSQAQEGETALEFARKLRYQDYYLNTPHKKLPDYVHKVEPPTSTAPATKAGEEAAQVRNVPQEPELVPKGDDPTLDAGVEQILKESPDLEIPTQVVVEEGLQEVVGKKVTTVFKELTDKTELANKFKECIK